MIRGSSGGICNLRAPQNTRISKQIHVGRLERVLIDFKKIDDPDFRGIYFFEEISSLLLKVALDELRRDGQQWVRCTQH